MCIEQRCLSPSSQLCLELSWLEVGVELPNLFHFRLYLGSSSSNLKSGFVIILCVFNVTLPTLSLSYCGFAGRALYGLSPFQNNTDRNNRSCISVI